MDEIGTRDVNGSKSAEAELKRLDVRICLCFFVMFYSNTLQFGSVR